MNKGSEHSPPSYKLPSTNLKFHDVPPQADGRISPILNKVVTVDNCYYYLALIERFWHYMDNMSVEQQRFYLARAEYRYELWVRQFKKNKMPTPPLDIAYVWHTHMLSPFRYYEDIVLRLPVSKSMFETPLPLADLHIERNGPSKLTLSLWEAIFGREPYSLTVDNMTDGVFRRPCYGCNHEIELPWVEYIDYRYGKCSTPFAHPCGHHRQINFLDVARLKLEADLTGRKEDRGPTVAGTLLGPNGQVKTKRNKIVALMKEVPSVDPPHELDYSYELEIESRLKSIGQKYEYDANELLYAIRTCYQSNPSPFSIDLIHAVGRQRKFHDSALSMDWSPPTGFISAIRRYHDFLFLMKQNPTLIAVPTVEIDCAWHLHMLFPPNYRRFTLLYLKRVINHDDTIPEPSLRKYASDTNKAWLRSPVKYMVSKMRQDGDTEYYEARLTVNTFGFGIEYYPGKIRLKKTDDHAATTILNNEIKNQQKSVSVSISAHCHDVTNAYYRDDSDIDQLKDLQEFIAEGMKNTSYGYIGTISCGTGGKGAIYASEDRSYSGIEVSSKSKNKWYQFGSRDKKLQNRYRDAEGSKCISDRFRDVNAPAYSVERAKSRDDLDMYTNMAAAGMFISYPAYLFAFSNYGAGGCGGGGTGWCGGSNCGTFAGCGGGGGGGCGGGGGGGGGCGGGGGGGC